MGGASIIQQYLQAGLVEELSIHIAPLLLGRGVKLFDHIGKAHNWTGTSKGGRNASGNSCKV